MAYRRAAIGLQPFSEAIFSVNKRSSWSVVSHLDSKPLNPLNLWIPRVSMSLLSMKKDPALEKALKINRRWTINNQLKSIIQWCPQQTASVDFLQKKFNKLDIRKGDVLNWVRKYPCLFETYTDNFLTYVRFSKRMRLLIEEEEVVKEQQEGVLAERLEKILMLTRKRRFSVVKFGDLRKYFGFPDDYVLRIAGKDGVFRVLDCEGKRKSLEIQLVEWNPRLAVSFVERKARERAKSMTESKNRLSECFGKDLRLEYTGEIQEISFGEREKGAAEVGSRPPENFINNLAVQKFDEFQQFKCEERKNTLLEIDNGPSVGFGNNGPVERVGGSEEISFEESEKPAPAIGKQLSEDFGKISEVQKILEYQKISRRESENPVPEFENQQPKGFGNNLPVKKLDDSEEISDKQGDNPVPEYENRLPEGFGNYSLEKFNRFQKIPYISPYEGIEGLQKDSEELEKWRVGVIHELLSLTLWKRASVAKLAKFQREFGFPENLVGFLMRHPAIFYVSNQNDIHTVVLREGYTDGELIDKDPFVVVKEKFGELMQEGLYEYTERRRRVNLEKIRKPNQPLRKMSNDFKQLGREIFKPSSDTTERKEERYQNEARERFRKAF